MAAEPELKIPVLTDEVTDHGAGSGSGAAIAPATWPEATTSEPEPSETHDRATAPAPEAPTAALSEAERQALIAELQTELASRTFELTDQIMRSAFAQMEATVFARISGRLRAELPEIIDSLLRERLSDDPDY